MGQVKPATVLSQHLTNKRACVVAQALSFLGRDSEPSGQVNSEGWQPVSAAQTDRQRAFNSHIFHAPQDTPAVNLGLDFNDRFGGTSAIEGI